MLLLVTSYGFYRNGQQPFVPVCIAVSLSVLLCVIMWCLRIQISTAAKNKLCTKIHADIATTSIIFLWYFFNLTTVDFDINNLKMFSLKVSNFQHPSLERYVMNVKHKFIK